MLQVEERTMERPKGSIGIQRSGLPYSCLLRLPNQRPYVKHTEPESGMPLRMTNHTVLFLNSQARRHKHTHGPSLATCRPFAAA